MSKSASILKVLQTLKQEPLPLLGPSVRSLRITLAERNAHYGARYVLFRSSVALHFVACLLTVTLEFFLAGIL